ncbi:hypothetical protein FAZ19_05255 [Sphingobacterium alkalisoli]|uniref:Uncharacterized protein n=1 Tax=Sphingobacterium alkalisoli TaxID=1874115 RepID=A0A4U0HA39_9SPHI|nr:hypothetical protein [Sphingobacterium alkalisoli]TJY68666.1 hypothetical protein FAZ19_05255 [Sphingobacterium alkalisoli]GGH04957.1 hypothetical protein GCM10011418_00860 [Sphingobacterium alkalisoli]
MKEKEIIPKTKAYSIRCSELEILIIYRLLILRLAKHLSGKEASFLMGKPLDYIDKVETFEIKRIYAHDLYVFTQVLDFENAGSAYPIPIDPNNEKNSYQMVVTNYTDRVIYDLKQVDSNNTPIKTIFLLVDTSNVQIVYNSDEEEYGKLKSTLHELFEEGYFSEERLAYDILYTCNKRMDSYIKPKKLMEIIQNHMEGKERFSLVQKKSSKPNFTGLVYIKKEMMTT